MWPEAVGNSEWTAKCDEQTNMERCPGDIRQPVRVRGKQGIDREQSTMAIGEDRQPCIVVGLCACGNGALDTTEEFPSEIGGGILAFDEGKCGRCVVLYDFRPASAEKQVFRSDEQGQNANHHWQEMFRR